MTLFDFHILRRFFFGYVFLVATLVIFFVVLHYVEYIDDFMDRGASMKEIFLVYYPSFIPNIVNQVSPLAIFLSCVYLTGRLAQELQIMALQTTGISLYRLQLPFVVTAVLISVFMFWFAGWIVPHTNNTVLEFESNYQRDGTEIEVAEIHRQTRRGDIITVGYFDRMAEIAHRVSMQHYDSTARMRTRMDCTRMEWVDSLQVWRIKDATIRTFSENGFQQQRSVAEFDTTIGLYPRDLARTDRDVESLTIPEAREYVQALQRSGISDIGRSLVSYYTKFAYPFANLILVLLGFPLASVRRRGGQAVQIGLGLLVAFFYLACMKLTEPFGYSGELSPQITAWLPHALFFFFSLLFLVRARK